MLKLKILDLCIFLQVREHDKIKCEDFINTFVDQIIFFKNSFRFYDLIFFLFLFILIFFVLKKFNTFY
jgi:hypothetical protein